MNEDLRLQDEHAVLTRLVESEGWLLMHSKWQKLIVDCNNSLKDKDNTTRDWYAGLLTGYERLFNWPQRRLMIIEKKLKELASGKETAADKTLDNSARRN